MRAPVAAALALAASVWALPAQAQQLLYTPPPPRGSAQVRFVNGTGTPLVVTSGVIPAASLGVATTDRVGSYATIPAVAGRNFPISVTAGTDVATLTLSFPADHQISVILSGDPKSLHADTITDEVEFNQVRSRLRFYNGAARCAVAGLVLKPGGQAVFADVKPGETRMRAVNPVIADVSASCGDEAGPDLKLEGMEVGRGYSVWLLAPQGKLMAFLSSDGNSLFQP